MTLSFDDDYINYLLSILNIILSKLRIEFKLFESQLNIFIFLGNLSHIKFFSNKEVSIILDAISCTHSIKLKSAKIITDKTSLPFFLQILFLFIFHSKNDLQLHHYNYLLNLFI